MDNKVDQNIHPLFFRSQEGTSISASPLNKKNPKFKTIIGIFITLILVTGSIISLYLTQINQDIRQQATDLTYLNDPDNCGSQGARCPDDTFCYQGMCSPGTEPVNGNCADGFHTVAGNSHCIPEQCNYTVDGNGDGSGTLICDNDGLPGGDTCTQESTGGDWCVNQAGVSVSCEEVGLSRCKCGSSGNGWWVIGMGDCDDICGDANAICTDCPPNDDTPDPINPPNPTTPPNATPTPTLPPGNTPTVTPAPTNTPTPTATLPPGPQCRNIEMWDVTNGTGTSITEDGDSSIIPGETTVRFTCSNFQADTLPSGYFYAFRIFEPCGSDNHLTPLEFINDEGENGVNYDIELAGDYQAQCSVCTIDSSGETICDWESLTPSSCE